MILTTDDLIADIKIRGAVPTSQDRFTNARFLSLANSEMQTKIFPMVLRARQNYFEYDVDTTVNASGLYHIHTRAYLGIVSNVALIDSSRRLNLPWLSEENEIDLDSPLQSRAGVVLKKKYLTTKTR